MVGAALSILLYTGQPGYDCPGAAGGKSGIKLNQMFGRPAIGVSQSVPGGRTDDTVFQ